MVELFTTGPESVMRLGRGTLAPGAPGDVTVFSTGRRMDLRRQSIRLAKPQFAVPRTHVPRRPDGHGSERRSEVAAVSGGANGQLGKGVTHSRDG